MLDYDVPRRARRPGLRAHPRPGVADRVAAARQGLGRGAGDGAAARHQPAHGRALRPRARARSSSPTSPPAGCDVPPRRVGRRRRPPADPYAVFRPRRGRTVALGVAVARRWSSSRSARSRCRRPARWSAAGAVVDRLMFVGSASRSRVLAVALRLDPGGADAATASSCATSSRPARLAWPRGRRRAVRRRRAWVTLDLDDTDTVAVMAIQKADGASAGPRPVAWPPSSRSTGSAPSPADVDTSPTATRGSWGSGRRLRGSGAARERPGGLDARPGSGSDGAAGLRASVEVRAQGVCWRSAPEAGHQDRLRDGEGEQHQPTPPGSRRRRHGPRPWPSAPTPRSGS